MPALDLFPIARQAEKSPIIANLFMENRWSEMEPHEGVLQANGFPSKLVKKTLSGQPRVNNTPDIEPQSLKVAPKLLCLPYVRGLSEKLQKIYAP